jgi:hypothetical protein
MSRARCAAAALCTAAAVTGCGSRSGITLPVVTGGSGTDPWISLPAPRGARGARGPHAQRGPGPGGAPRRLRAVRCRGKDMGRGPGVAGDPGPARVREGGPAAGDHRQGTLVFVIDILAATRG